MNNLIESAYVLHNLWSNIKKTIYKYNIKYLVLPVLYLTVIILVVPNPNIEVNKIKISKQDSYKVFENTKEDKIDYILEKYNLTDNEFKVLSAIVLTEAEENSYNDAYAVINTIYNRTHSKNWIKSVENRFGKNKGTNLYYQAISPNQFVVYQNGTYKRNLNNTKSPGYDAIIDFLYTEKVMHEYLSFRSNNIKVKNSVAFSSKGNNYFNALDEKNRV